MHEAWCTASVEAATPSVRMILPLSVSLSFNRSGIPNPLQLNHEHEASKPQRKTRSKGQPRREHGACGVPHLRASVRMKTGTGTDL